MFPRRGRVRSRTQGSRWGTGRSGGRALRSTKEWTGFYEYPGCGGIQQLQIVTSNECWSQQNVIVLPPSGSTATEGEESTLLAFRGSVEPWCVLNPDGSFGATGIGIGLQLCARRNVAGVGVQDFPRFWDDADNPDWLYRRWFPAQTQNIGTLAGEISPGVFGDIILCADPAQQELGITSRRVSWKDWALYWCFAIPASDDDTQWFIRIQGRLYEAFAPGASIVQ